MAAGVYGREYSLGNGQETHHGDTSKESKKERADSQTGVILLEMALFLSTCRGMNEKYVPEA